VLVAGSNAIEPEVAVLVGTPLVKGITLDRTPPVTMRVVPSGTTAPATEEVATGNAEASRVPVMAAASMV